ncbi:MAG: replication factor C small subunit [Candidatus Diapherotrites archaeon]
MELPWVEKYRPQKLEDVVGQKETTTRLKNYVKTRNVPNLLFSGPAGTGKTSAAVSLAKELYGTEFERNFLELNASDERGIDVVRKTIKDFARTLAFNADFKIIFLDESDALTSDAQQALRRTMEKYTKTARFCLSCNYSSKIIEPIQSRCVVFRYRPLTATDIAEKMNSIAKTEKLKIDSKAMEALVYVSQGDLRKAVNVLQAVSSYGSEITEDAIYKISSRAKPAEIKEMIDFALKGKFLDARSKLNSLLYEYGMSGEDVIVQLYREVMNSDSIEDKTKIELVDVIGEYNFRMVEGANERIQLEALLAQFMKYKK